ncbi:MAG: hypothetical protein J7500_14220 [Sphingomonas sp.]|uniref:hypothetical protein n=1 Tax=Sphingomonas sp. TaxID=28214 RepID=UPI001B2E4D1E|nr:hypothetical protein [Sphingomonas sp.]MBO9623860.1 hypothetical protein [Sphingomonas sp.]
MQHGATVTPRVRGEWWHAFQDGVRLLDYTASPAHRISARGLEARPARAVLGSTLRLPSAWMFDPEMALRVNGPRSVMLRKGLQKEF